MPPGTMEETMMTIKSYLVKRPVLTYYILTFAVSWGGVLLVVGGPDGIPGAPGQFETLILSASLALVAGPTLAGLLMTGLVGGRAGYRDLLSRLLRWRVGARWYAAALLAAPLLMMAIPLALALLFPEFLPRIFPAADKAPILVLAVVAGLMAGIFEELGWTGFAIPRLRLRYGILATGLLVGFLWGAWHLLVNTWSSGSPAGGLSPALLLHSVIFSMGILPPYRVLMVWVYDRTGDSLLLAMLMHFSLTAGNVIFVPAASGTVLVAWSLVLAVALWVVVGAVAAANRGRLSRGPLSKREIGGAKRMLSLRRST
jgi:uncharacterized protein